MSSSQHSPPIHQSLGSYGPTSDLKNVETSPAPTHPNDLGPYHHESDAQHEATPAHLASGAPYPNVQAYTPQNLSTAPDDASTLSHALSTQGQLPTLYPTSGPSSDSNFPAIDNRFRSQTSPERLAQGVLNMSDQPRRVAAETPENERRKKNKVSRACDECRRRKIRCDATLEAPDEACTTCKKSGAPCRFNRPPLKRGPNKGYITQLTDRVSTLEHQLGPQAVVGSPQYPQGERPEFPSPSLLDKPRKRKRSGVNVPAQLADRQPSEATHGFSDFMPSNASYSNSPPRLEHEALRSGRYEPSSSVDSGAWRYAAPNGERTRIVTTTHNADERDSNATFPGWDENLVKEYYRIIHPTFPLLPNYKLRLRQRLALCPATLRNAFLVALNSLIHIAPSSHTSLSPAMNHSIKRATELIGECQFEHSVTQPLSAGLIYLQALILMTLGSDNHGPSIMRGQFGPPRAEWLGRAVGIAVHLKLNLLTTHDANDVGETDEEIGRRAWWILFVLDRWHASSTPSLLLLPEDSSRLRPEDQAMLGESTYHLARLSHILSHLSMILQQPASLMSADSAAGTVLARTILGELDRFRESVESLLVGKPNIVQLAYWHVRLMALSLTSTARPDELTLPATRIANILNRPSSMNTPLNHHFAALAALILAELCKVRETRRAGEKGIADLIEALGSPHEDSTGWDRAVRGFLLRTRGGQEQGASRTRDGPVLPSSGGGAVNSETEGLQHLADAAVGGNSDNNGRARRSDMKEVTGQNVGPSAATGSTAFNPSGILHHGYLAALIQENEAEAEERWDGMG